MCMSCFLDFVSAKTTYTVYYVKALVALCTDMMVSIGDWELDACNVTQTLNHLIGQPMH